MPGHRTRRWREQRIEAEFTPFEIRGYATCFVPTHYLRLADTLFLSRGEISPIQLYDLARFVEDFVLADSILVPRSFRHIACEEFESHDPSCSLYFRSIEDDLILTSSAQHDVRMIVADIHEGPRILGDQDFQRLSTAVKEGANFHEVFRTLGKPADSTVLEIKAQGQFRDLLYVYYESDQYAKDLHAQVIHNLTAEEEPSITAPDISPLLGERVVSISPGVGLIKAFEDTGPQLTRDLYDIVAKHFRIKVERLHKALRTHVVYIPPLLTILFSRMRTTADFPKSLTVLRKEFGDLRQEIGRYEQELRSAKTLKEKIELVEEMEGAQETLAKKIAGRTQKTFVRRSWNIVKGMSPLKIGANALDALLEYDADRLSLNRVRRYVDIYSLAVDAVDYERQLGRLFPDRVREWDKLPLIAKAVETLIPERS
ncbi:MAG TPA: hypothetical protein VF179_04600 [Thermoanaerobaculia bacterium]|nr:hypothetical protein [Thermoanaerobaculia bacterium]